MTRLDTPADFIVSSLIDRIADAVVDRIKRNATPAPSPSKLKSREEMRTILGVSASTFVRNVRAGIVPVVRIGRRPMFDPEKTIAAFAK